MLVKNDQNLFAGSPGYICRRCGVLFSFPFPLAFSPSLSRALLSVSHRVMLPALLMFGAGTASSAPELLNINNADVQTIADTLNGIGPAKAQAIVDHRQQYGAFLQLEDLVDVPGIGDTTLEQNRALITVTESLSDD